MWPAGSRAHAASAPAAWARTREFTSRAFRFLSSPTRYPLTEALFLRLLGLTYIAAFGSLLPQVKALFGSQGIVSVASLLTEARSQYGATAYWALPTLFWFGVPDAALVWVCVLGCIAGLLLLAGWATGPAAFAAWMLYLSLISVGSPFTNFQWDALLLEAGFLALFAGSSWLVWGYRLLLFRLMFESGLVKLASGDPNWHNLHALRYHFFTQPLPTPLAWYAARLPGRVLDALTAMVLVIELVAPLLIFAPRPIRRFGVAALLALQVGILLTGNYGFFNLLSMALCLWGLDDDTFRPLARFLRTKPASPRFGSFRVLGNIAIACVLLLGIAQFLESVPELRTPGLLYRAQRLVARFEIVNRYGLFAVMTTSREEIILQGSNDGQHWLDYELPYKPGETHRPLPWVAPHMPRLDWQMWFAALGTFNENRWMGAVMYRLLVGDREVTGLFLKPPFSKPPHYMRAELYEYTFASPAERSRTGAVWHREWKSAWFGPVSLTGR
jgi:hypothetical protein